MPKNFLQNPNFQILFFKVILEQLQIYEFFKLLSKLYAILLRLVPSFKNKKMHNLCSFY